MKLTKLKLEQLERENDLRLQRLGDMSVDIYEDILLGQEYIPKLLRKDTDLWQAFIEKIKDYFNSKNVLYGMQNPSNEWINIGNQIAISSAKVVDSLMFNCMKKVLFLKYLPSWIERNAIQILENSNLDNKQKKYDWKGNIVEKPEKGQKLYTEKELFKGWAISPTLGKILNLFIGQHYLPLVKKYKYWNEKKLGFAYKTEHQYFEDIANSNYTLSYVTSKQYYQLPDNLKHELFLMRKSTQNWTVEIPFLKDADTMLCGLVETILGEGSIAFVKSLPKWLRDLYENSKQRNLRLQKY